MRTALPLTFFWLGFVVAISFFEAPLKFTAPCISIEEGVEIGRIVFGWLNKLEIGFAALLLIYLVLRSAKGLERAFILLLSVIVVVQTLWFLPALDAQAQLLFDGVTERDKTYHHVYVISEIVKVGGLIWLGIVQVRNLRIAP